MHFLFQFKQKEFFHALGETVRLAMYDMHRWTEHKDDDEFDTPIHDVEENTEEDKQENAMHKSN